MARVGLDTGTPVAIIEYHYDTPFKFTGKLDKLTFDLGPAQLTEENRRTLAQAQHAIARGRD